VHFLRERALQFYEQATFTLERGYCEMLFNIEQALQLYMKYLLYRKIGDYPKSHFLRDIADRLVEIYETIAALKITSKGGDRSWRCWNRPTSPLGICPLKPGGRTAKRRIRC